MLRPYQNIYGKLKVGKGTTFGAFVDIGDAEFGEGCKVQSFVSIPDGWKFGNNVFIGPGARFANDDKPRVGMNWNPNGGYVHDGASIGMGACIGAGVIIGKGAMVGMGAVVTKNVPDGETWVGNPAHKL